MEITGKLGDIRNLAFPGIIKGNRIVVTKIIDHF